MAEEEQLVFVYTLTHIFRQTTLLFAERKNKKTCIMEEALAFIFLALAFYIERRSQ
jgi:hypothetical protein